jgi:hypothetical protein
MKSFSPLAGATVTLSAGAASSSVALAGPPSGSFQVRIHNAGSATAFVRFGAADIEASADADLPVPPGAVEVMTLDNPARDPITHAAAITETGSATLYVTPGRGL